MFCDNEPISTTAGGDATLLVRAQPLVSNARAATGDGDVNIALVVCTYLHVSTDRRTDRLFVQFNR